MPKLKLSRPGVSPHPLKQSKVVQSLEDLAGCVANLKKKSSTKGKKKDEEEDDGGDDEE